MIVRRAGATLILLAGCGGTTLQPSDAGTDVAADTSVDGGYTECIAPSGHAICGGVHHCSGGGGCTCAPNMVDNPEPRPCGTNQLAFDYEPGGRGYDCMFCREGSVCLDWFEYDILQCGPFDLAYLMSQGGASQNRIRYYDRGFFTGTPLPDVGVCPNVPGVKICGGNCGACAKDEYCVGRSPLHPVGFCLSSVPNHFSCSSKDKCTTYPGDGCFRFSVEAGAQPVANEFGLCMPLAQCQALAAGLPGGGTCTP